MICIALLLYINSKAFYINYNKIKRLLQVLIAMNESERRCDPQVL